LRRIGGPAKKEVLNPEPLLRGVAGLDAVAAAVLILLAVQLTPLSAALFKEAADGDAPGILDITIAMGNL
jgi:hypothetical protein